MANKLYEESSIQAIANAIRSKNGSSDTYTVSQMSTAIDNIPSGGSSTALQGLPLNNQKNNVILNTLEDNTSVNNPFSGATDWGDGTTDSSSTHTYTKAGYYTISSSTNIANSASKQIIEAEIVTSLGYVSTAFQDNTNLIKAIVPNLVESLFQGCTDLKKLTVTGSVTNIPNSCFTYVDMDCWDIPNTITSIGSSAFQYAKNIVFPNNTISATNIGAYAFRYANFKNKILTINAETINSYAFDSTDLKVVKFTNLNQSSLYNNNILYANNLCEVMFNDTVGSEILSSVSIIPTATVYRNIHFTSTSPVRQYTTTVLNLSSKDTVYCPVGYLSNYQTAFSTILNGADLLEEPANGITFSYNYYNTSLLSPFTINGYVTNNSNEDKAITSISFNYGDALLDNSTATLNIGSSYLIAGVYDTTNHTITFTVDEIITTAELSKAFNIFITPTSSSGGLYTVPKNAFTCTAGLVWIIPEGTTTVGTDYKGNTDLVKVVIPSSVTTVSANAFEDCTNLTGEISSTSITSVGTKAFYNTGITRIYLPNVYLEGGIEDQLYFGKCTSLTEATIGSVNATDTQKMATFKNCTNLTTATILRGTGTGRSMFYACSSLTTVNLPNTLEIINSYSFNGTALTTLTIPASVTTIGSSAFHNCTSMQEYHFLPTTPPTIGNTDTFGNIPNNCIIYVPASSVTAYQTATNWSNYALHIQAEPS